MKCNKIFRTVALVIILALLLVAFPVVPTHASDGVITLHPDEGEIGDWIEINGRGFDANETVSIYFSSDKAFIGGGIDNEVTAYEQIIRIVLTNADGDFDASFSVPAQLTDGKDKEDVHGGDYYVYVTYYDSTSIRDVAEFTVIGGEIELDPEEGQVGSEVRISGEGLRQGQKITIEYDGHDVDIASGDEQTDNEGKFTCAIIIPESAAGNHIITVIDESGNRPEAEFSVKPKITLAPTSQAAGKPVEVSGTGFGEKEVITITFDGYAVFTDPILIKTNRKGSFSASFFVPSYAMSGISKIEAGDGSFNTAEAQLTILILAIPADISLRPTTSQTSPGYVGMELTINGTRFIANTMVTITYSNNEDITVATATTDADGDFSATFTVPPSVAGSHPVTSTDGISTATVIFIMESEAPPMPVPLLPKVASTAEAEAYFDWTDIEDPSGVTYTLQVALDADFTTIVLQREGLLDSEYTITEEEKLESTEKEPPYYWRVKAVDSTSSESDWTPSGLFYVGFHWTSIPSWAVYIWIGLGGLLLAVLGLWVRRITTHH